MNGYLLLLDQEKSRAINGKKPNIAKMARRPTSRSAPTQPGATGIRTVKAAAVATKIIGVLQKIGLSAPDGAIISFEINFKPSAINCNIPSIFPAYNGPVLNCILAKNFLSTKIVVAAINAAKAKPGNTADLKKSV